MPNENEKAQSDLNERVKAFNAELIPLLGKYKLGLGAQALILPDGRLAAKPSLFDDVKEKAESAPVDAEAGEKESSLASA